MLISAGADPEAPCKGGNYTPLAMAATLGNLAIVDLLLSMGVDRESCTLNLYTPLYIACMHGHAEVVGTLLAAGVQIEATDRQGHTPLHAGKLRCTSRC